MAENTKIEWCDATVNWWIGCSKVSPGCSNCYAESWDRRYHAAKHWGPEAPRIFRHILASHEAERLNRKSQREGRRLKVFTNSLADFFEDREDLDTPRVDALRRMLETPHLDWLILTKRPERALPLLRRIATRSPLATRVPGWLDGLLPPPENIWIGTTVEDHDHAPRIQALLEIPAKVHFLSLEPLLGPVDLQLMGAFARQELWKQDQGLYAEVAYNHPRLEIPGIDWVIVGGESGHGARPMHPDWVRTIREQCAAAGVPFLFKQWGEWGSSAENMLNGEPTFRIFRDFEHWCAKGHSWMAKGDIILDASGNRCHCGGDIKNGLAPFTVMRKVGKVATGRLLDGVQHDGYPALEFRDESGVRP